MEKQAGNQWNQAGGSLAGCGGGTTMVGVGFFFL
jgi:hypothetical protein